MTGEEIAKVKNKEQAKVIDWSKVLTNSISLLVATVFVGAAATLWNKGDKIQADVTEALRLAEGTAKDTEERLRSSQASNFATQEEWQHDFSHEIAGLTLALDALREQLENFAESLPDNGPPDLPATGARFPAPTLRPEQIESERDRIIRDIQKRQRAINPGLADYDAVQALYIQAKPADTCREFRRIVEQMQLYLGNDRLVPESHRYTVRHSSTTVGRPPSAMSNPTISDLATDRITRIKNANPECFP